jgi:hypothetical protein
MTKRIIWWMTVVRKYAINVFKQSRISEHFIYVKRSTKQVHLWYITKRYIIYGGQEAKVNSFTVQATISQFMPFYNDYSRINFLIFGMLVTALLPALACLKQ